MGHGCPKLAIAVISKNKTKTVAEVDHEIR